VYFLAAGSLPGASAYVAACAGAAALALCALALLPGREHPVGLAVLGIGAGLLAVALNTRDVGAEATPVEALFGAAAGLLFASGFAAPAAVVALPLVVGGIDVASALGGAGTVAVGQAGGDLLALDLPAWGAGGAVPSLGLLDATFLALFASWAVRYRLHPRVAIPLMVAGLAAALVLSLASARSFPTLAFLAGAFLLASLDRVPALLRSDQ
jgi:hypothetical protein